MISPCFSRPIIEFWLLNTYKMASRLWMEWIAPVDFFRRFRSLDVEVDHDRFLSAANEYAVQWLITTGIDLLMRHIWRHKDKVSRSSFGDKLQMRSPAHSGTATHHINDAFHRAVMMRTRF